MSLLLYLAVLLVSALSVMFGLGWLSTPEPRYAAPPVQVASHAPAPAPDRLAPLSPDMPVRPAAAPATKPAIAAATPAAPAAQAVATAAAAPTVASDAAPSADQADVTPTAEAAAPSPPAPACDIAACTRAYHTFTASDCTYQPSWGPRRLCTKGTPPAKTAAAAAPSGVDARAQTTPAQAPACNIAACQAAYRSFDPADCTYQPNNGPRRICSK
jgi:hypothetical protein